MEKDSRLTFPIILIVTLIFIGIATLFFVRYQNKVRMSKQEKILEELKEQKEKIKPLEYEGKG